MNFKTRLGWGLSSLLIAAGAAAGFATAGASAASAATVCAPLASVSDVGYQSPIHGGLALDAVGWGGGQSAANACTGAQVNDRIVVWQTSHAGVAADFTPVLTTTGNYQLVYTPGNQVSVTAPLCISTVTDSEYAYARLRGCAGLTVTVNGATGQATMTAAAGNEWQNFKFVPQGDGFNQIEAVQELSPGPFVLNIKGWGGDGTQVISFPGTGAAENQIFERVFAP